MMTVISVLFQAETWLQGLDRKSQWRYFSLILRYTALALALVLVAAMVFGVHE